MSKVGDLPVRILAEALTLLGMLNEPWVLFGMPFADPPIIGTLLPS